MSAEKAVLMRGCRIIDVSQPIGEKTACFPGDVPFSRKMTVSYEQSHTINLSALTMSPHVGTHADAPVHVRGTMGGESAKEDRQSNGEDETAATLPLEPFFGPVLVIDLAPHHEAIEFAQIEDVLSQLTKVPERIIFKTRQRIRYHVFENAYAYFTVGLVNSLAALGVKLIGIDTPSVDHVQSKSLEVHHALLAKNICWLENLDLTNAHAKEYVLIALPLKFTQLEASPVRAVLLD